MAAEEWLRVAIHNSPMLNGADWVQVVALRSSSTPVDTAFASGFSSPSRFNASAGMGMSEGGVSSSLSIEPARRMAAEGGSIFVVCCTGLYLPSVDRQNRLEEVFGSEIPAQQVVGCVTNLEETTPGWGSIPAGYGSRTIRLNDRFRRPPWAPWSDIDGQVRSLIGDLRPSELAGKDMFRQYMAWRWRQRHVSG